MQWRICGIVALWLWLASVTGAYAAADPNATTATKQVLTYLQGLRSQSTHKVLTGSSIWRDMVQDNIAKAAGTERPPYEWGQPQAVFDATGQWPAIVTLIEHRSDTAKAFAVAHWNAGGLIQSHILAGNSPDSWYGHVPLTNAEVTAVMTDPRYIAILDQYVADFLYYQSQGVVILNRLYFEMNGNWNWFSAPDPNVYKTLWIHFFNYMTSHGVHNLLYYYCPNAGSGNYLSFYPGDQYVDIVGLDNYADLGTSPLPVWAGYSELSAVGKPLMIGEYGFFTLNLPLSYQHRDSTYLLQGLQANMPNVVGVSHWTIPYDIAAMTNPSTYMTSTYVQNRPVPWATPVQSGVFWDDELEAGNTGYTLPGIGTDPVIAMTFDTSEKFSGTGSLRYNFDPTYCYPDANAQSYCHGFTDRNFTPTDNYYRRVYVKLSASFVVSDVYTKMFRTNTNDPSSQYGVSNWWGMGCCNWNLLGVDNQNVPGDGQSSHHPTTYEIPRNQWVCIETYEQMNTPGVANGISRAWADGVMILNKTDVAFRQVGESFQFNGNRLYRQTGQGSIWFDRLAAADTRIGCLGSTPPPSDTTPPSVPTGLAAVSGAGGSVSVSWTNSSVPDLAGATIRRMTGVGTPTQAISTVSSPTAAFVDTSVAPNTTYSYSVNNFDTSANQSSFTAAVQVTTPATYRTTLHTDAWARADSADLGASYQAGYTAKNALKITSQRVLSTVVNTQSVEQFTGVATPNDQWCEFTIGAFGSTSINEMGCFVRLQNSPTNSGYLCRAANTIATNKAALRRVDAGVVVGVLGSNTTVVWGAGDVARCEAIGTTINYYRRSGGVETLLLQATDATYASGTTGLYNYVETGGALSDSQLAQFSMGGYSAGAASSVALDSTSNSASGNTTNTISWNHTVGTGSNRLLLVCPVARDSATSGNTVVSTVTANGLALTKIRADLYSGAGIYLNTELWALVAPGSGTQSIAITWGGAPNRYGVGSAISLTGVDQVSANDANNGSTGTGTSISRSLTTVANHAAIVDCAVAQGSSLTVGSGQVERVNRQTSGTVDFIGMSTVLDKTPAGAETMDWTQGTSEGWAISTASFVPATVTPAVPPTIASATLSVSGATLTHGATTSTTIRVVVGSNSSPVTITTIEPIASFPAGVYTRTWPNGYDFVCFYPRDSLGVENTDPAANKCGSLSGIVAALDVTPIVMTQALPAGTLNQGTTNTTIAASLDKPGSCKYAPTNIAYSAMTLVMDPANLLRSATGTGLSDGTTTHFYVHCSFTNAIGTEITTSVALDIAVTVAAGAPSDTTVPSTVTDLAGTNLSQSQVQLVWAAASDNIGIQGYQAYQDLTGTCTGFVPVGLPVTTTEIVANLPPNHAVSFVVRAIDTSQNYSSADSNCVTITTVPMADTVPPATMANLRIVDTAATAILIAFDEGTDNAGLPKATIEKCTGDGCADFVSVRTDLASTQLHVDLATSTVFCFRGFFTDASGNRSAADSNVVCGTTVATNPGTITNVAVSEQTYSSLVIVYDAATDNVGINRYEWEVCQGAACTNFAPAGTSSGVSFPLSGLSANTTYRLRGKAADFAGNLSLDYSNPLTVTTDNLPDGVFQGVCPCKTRP